LLLAEATSGTGKGCTEAEIELQKSFIIFVLPARCYFWEERGSLDHSFHGKARVRISFA